MRTTLTIDDRLAAALKRRSLETGQSFKAVVNEVLRLGLEGSEALPKARAYQVEPVSLGETRPGVDLDKALGLAAGMEDDELARKMLLRK